MIKVFIKKLIFKFDGSESNFFYREHRHKKITTMAPKKLQQKMSLLTLGKNKKWF